MARKRRKGASARGSGDSRESAETLNFQTRSLETQTLERNQIIDNPPAAGGGGPDMHALGDLAQSIRELVSRFAVGSAGGGGGGLGGGGGGGSPGSQGGGASAAPPAALNVSAAQRFLQNQQTQQTGPAPGLSGLSRGGASGVAGGVLKLADKFAGEVGGAIARSPLEVSASQAAREHGIDPGRFTESALGAAAAAGVPGAGLLTGLAAKANADADARSGRTAFQMARGRLADIAGGLAARGAHFTDSQLMQARDVLQERAQRELNVRMQIRGLEDGIGAQRSGLGSAGHAR